MIKFNSNTNILFEIKLKNYVMMKYFNSKHTKVKFTQINEAGITVARQYNFDFKFLTCISVWRFFLRNHIFFKNFLDEKN